jgi:small-conductance mechanosensitive channel
LSSLGGIWNYELTSIDDTSLTVGKVVSSVLFLFFGFFAARGLSRMLGKRLPKLGVDDAGASIIESLSFYALLLAFGLTALRYANVPLTAFTFLGGAIAIGVGFGSQNILNNFISGLILLAERPIKVGDLIQLGETYGNVTKIGPRSTQIRTGENLDIIVPNSKFLENDVTNLTRRDDRLRTSICIGVAYGSPLDQVVGLLELAARDAKDVQELPTPMVWFNDFGDNSLVFQVNFWIKARTLAQMRRIETEVRLSIDRLFRANDIVIAFPQRDLHIQTQRPIDLRLIHDRGGEPLCGTE